MPNHYGTMHRAGRKAAGAGRRKQMRGIFRSGTVGGLRNRSARSISPTGKAVSVRRGYDNGRKAHKFGPGVVQGVNTRRVKPSKIVKMSSTKIARSDGKYGSHAIMKHWDNGRN